MVNKIYIVAEIKDEENGIHNAGVYEYREGTVINIPTNAVALWPAKTKKAAMQYKEMINNAIKNKEE